MTVLYWLLEYSARLIFTFFFLSHIIKVISDYGRCGKLSFCTKKFETYKGNQTRNLRNGSERLPLRRAIPPYTTFPPCTTVTPFFMTADIYYILLINKSHLFQIILYGFWNGHWPYFNCYYWGDSFRSHINL